jgi:hypothetical protein
MAGIGTEFGLTAANALNVSANNHGISVDGLIGDLRALIAEMEADVDAQQGAALTAFQNAKNDFFATYDQMAGKYGFSALGQDQTSTDGTGVDDLNEAEYASAGGGVPSISASNIQI